MAESWASSEHTRRAMQGNRSRDTAPELAVRRRVHAMGLRYRVNARPLPQLRRTADLVFPRRKVAVFIDGCFWHGCPEHHRRPTANSEYWTAKVARNKARDSATDEALTAAGWTVLRFWAHQPPEQVADAVRATVTGAPRGPDPTINTAPVD
ncbi:very short patch repair endonuclease [Mycolicibacterium brumae]|uniref:very short patch repair endonuclease n=1 Tax=Mycolicibacterium brumae TaxID=85968 RepID=UPI000AD7D219|nr:very short patch repair endonuclease [Mycolicibacterium brumae]RWA21986.1 Fis family transcriptional regulator [Mycolicibacterium brumae DSM 44177]